MTKKILYLFDASDWESRIEVAKYAKKDGYEVVIGLIGDEKTHPDFKTVPVRKTEGSMRFSALSMVKEIRKIIEGEAPDILHVVTLKYSFIAGIAALSSRQCKKIFTLAGLGYLFRGDSKKSKLLRLALTPFLKYIFKRPQTTLIFQNRDDQNLFIKQGFAKEENTVLIKGSGVYLDRFEGRAEEAAPPVVLMPTRLVHEKGLSVFIDAARILKQKGSNAQFQIAGGATKHNPKAISRNEMEEMIRDGAVEWLGRVDDLPQRLARAAIIVYPSYYGEGIPRVLLEACAAGKPIITTDHPGCREAVDHEQNGLLVPVKDAQKTAEAIELLLSDTEKRKIMGKNSRKKAVKEFDIHSIATQTVAVYGR